MLPESYFKILILYRLDNFMYAYFLLVAILTTIIVNNNTDLECSHCLAIVVIVFTVGRIIVVVTILIHDSNPALEVQLGVTKNASPKITPALEMGKRLYCVSVPPLVL